MNSNDPRPWALAALVSLALLTLPAVADEPKPTPALKPTPTTPTSDRAKQILQALLNAIVDKEYDAALDRFDEALDLRDELYLSDDPEAHKAADELFLKAYALAQAGPPAFQEAWEARKRADERAAAAREAARKRKQAEVDAKIARMDERLAAWKAEEQAAEAKAAEGDAKLADQERIATFVGAVVLVGFVVMILVLIRKQRQEAKRLLDPEPTPPAASD